MLERKSGLPVVTVRVEDIENAGFTWSLHRGDDRYYSFVLYYGPVDPNGVAEKWVTMSNHYETPQEALDDAFNAAVEKRNASLAEQERYVDDYINFYSNITYSADGNGGLAHSPYCTCSQCDGKHCGNCGEPLTAEDINASREICLKHSIDALSINTLPVQ